MITKVCKSCGKEFPATIDYFHRDSSGKLGLKGRCKLCINGEKYRFVDKNNHLCKSCGRELPFTEEYFVNNPKSNKLTSPCRECRGLSFGKLKYKKITENCVEGNKICIKCRKEYPLDKFHFLKQSSSKDGFSQRCRKCDNTKFVEQLPNLKDNEKYCNKCKTIKDKSNFYLDNSKKDKLSTICKSCRKEYNVKNRTKRNFYLNKRRRKDVNFRILNSLRCRISAALKNNVKSKNTKKLLGCSIENFIIYIENKMSKEMNWNNYGTCWHIDHIIPCCYFDLILEEEQLQCFNYKNLQPMFAKDNLIKQGYSKLQVIYKTSEEYKNSNYQIINKYMIDER